MRRLQSDQPALSELVRNAVQADFRVSAAEHSTDKNALTQVLDQIPAGSSSERERIRKACAERLRVLEQQERKEHIRALEGRLTGGARLGLTCQSCGRPAVYHLNTIWGEYTYEVTGYFGCDCGGYHWELRVLDDAPAGEDDAELCSFCLGTKNGRELGSLRPCHCTEKFPSVFVPLRYDSGP